MERPEGGGRRKLAPDLTGKHAEISGPGEDKVSSPLAGTREVSGCDGLDSSRGRVQELGGFWDATGLSYFSEFLKEGPTHTQDSR